MTVYLKIIAMFMVFAFACPEIINAQTKKEASSFKKKKAKKKYKAKKKFNKKLRKKKRVGKKKAAAKTQTSEPDGIPLPQLRSVALLGTAYNIKITGPFAEVLKPIINKSYPDNELKAFKKALSHIRRKQFTKAKNLSKKVKDPLMLKFLAWYTYVNSPSSYTIKELTEFSKSHPDWPRLKTLKIAVEAKLLTQDLQTKQKYLKDQIAHTNAGMLSKAEILFEQNKKDEAVKIIRKIWRGKKVSGSVEDIIIDKYKEHLNEEDHFFKAQRYLFRNSRKSIAAANKIAKYLSPEKRKQIKEQIALLKNTKSARQKIKELKKQGKLYPLIIYREVKKLRRKKKYSEAWTLLKLAPNDPEKLVIPKVWWRQKRSLIHAALNKKEYKIAYEIAKNHGQSSVNELNDAEFTAGWIAYRFLKDAKKAYPHFVALGKTADGPRSSSRSHYWMGRTALIQGYKVKAQQHFNDGAKFYNTFYGQLSKQSLDPKDDKLKIPEIPQPTETDIKSFSEHDAVKAIILAHKADKKYLVNRFISHLRYRLTKPGQMILLADLAKQIGRNQQSLRVGKTAMFKGINAAEYAYPTHVIPSFKPLTELPEPAFYFAIARQESEFNAKIKSHAGARGLMQVMPATAKYLARKFKISYKRSKLTEDPGYNVQLGTAYISGRLREFSGSYIKTIAGFNAGPGNVNKWVKSLGDPSDKNVDPIDWIERIPFRETRNYVKKVIANMQVYRSRLGTPEKALKIHSDLVRGRKEGHKTYKPIMALN